MTGTGAVITETAMGFAGVLLSPDGIARATLFKADARAVAADLGIDEDERCAADRRAEEVVGLLAAYATGSASLDDYPVDVTRGTPFQQAVWGLLRQVPRGEMRSYGWVAKRLGLGPGSARAVGAAVGANPIPLWVPCHRIIGSDGSLHGFAGGLEMKRALLELEGALPPRLA